MKYLLSCLLLLLSVSSVKAQKIDSAAVARLSPELKQQVNNYLIEARKAKTAAMVMSIGGGSLAFAGAIVVMAAATEEMATGLFAVENWDYDPNTQPPDDYSGKANIGTAMFLVGAACALGSIPMFIKVHKKRNAARAIVFADKGMAFTPNTIMPGTSSAGIRLVIPLGK